MYLVVETPRMTAKMDKWPQFHEMESKRLCKYEQKFMHKQVKIPRCVYVSLLK